MKLPEDDVWDKVVDHMEMQVSDAELAAAERELRDVERQPMRPELIERVMAQAEAEVAARVARVPVVVVETKAPARVIALPRTRRAAAAAAAFLGMNKLTAATAVTTMAVVTAVALWPRHHSAENMTYGVAVEILRSGSLVEEDAGPALGQVTRRVQGAIGILQMVRDDPTSTHALADAARRGLVSLAAGAFPPAPSFLDDIDLSAASAADGSRDEAERLHHVQHTVLLAACGLSAIRDYRNVNLESEQRTFLRMLRGLLSH